MSHAPSETLSGRHRLWVDKAGNVYFRDDPANDGERLRDMRKILPVWFRSGLHPVFQISAGGNVALYKPPPERFAIGAVAIVWYDAVSFILSLAGWREKPVFLMIRQNKNPNAKEGSFLVSVWRNKHLEGVSPPPPVEIVVRGSKLDQIEGRVDINASFSGLSEKFRAKWKQGWGTPLQKPGRNKIPEGGGVLDVIEAALGNTKELAADATDDLFKSPFGKGLLTLAVVAVGLLLLLKFRR